MPAAAARRAGSPAFAAGVEDYVWSPDGERLALIALDPECPGGHAEAEEPAAHRHRRATSSRKTAPATSATRRKHLYLVDIASGKAEQLTSGAHDEQLPAWSPDGRPIAYVTKRGAGPGPAPQLRHLPDRAAGPARRERQLTTFAGSDLDPYWETRPGVEPGRHSASPTCRAARTSGSTTRRGSWRSSTSRRGKATVPRRIDRCFYKPRWAPDGKIVYALVEQSRVTHLSRIDLAGRQGHRADQRRRASTTTSMCPRMAAWWCSAATTISPTKSPRWSARSLRALTDHNDWLAQQAAGARRGDQLPQQGRHEHRGLAGQAGRLPGGQALPDDPAHPRRAGLPVQPRIHGRLAGLRRAAATPSSRSIRAAAPAAASTSPRDLCRLGQQGRAGRAGRRRSRGGAWASPIPNGWASAAGATAASSPTT